MSKLTIVTFGIFTGVLLFATSAQASWWYDLMHPSWYSGPRYSDSKLYSYDIGLEKYNGTVEALGDFDSDRYVDLFVVSSNRSEIDVYLWNKDDWDFGRLSGARVTTPNIINLTPSDYNYDGKLDLLVTGALPDGSYYVKLYLGNNKDLQESSTTIPPPSEGQFLLMDSNNDLKPDMFGVFQGVRTFWQNNGEGQFKLVNQTSLTQRSVKNSNSHAFVDFNGDCLADLLITSVLCSDDVPRNHTDYECNTVLEIWINKKSSYQYLTNYTIPQGAGQISFADLDGDGDMDILFPVCDPWPNCNDTMAIYLAYNSQEKVCSNPWSASGGCKSASDLCKADDDWHFSNMNVTSSTSNVVVITGDQLGWPDKRFYISEDDPSGEGTFTIRAGDYNLDGYPDILIPFVDAESRETKIELWKNVGCSDSDCGSSATDKHHRTFHHLTSGVDELESIKNPYAAFWFDLGDNGLLDIMVLTDSAVEDPTGPRNRSINAIYNNFFLDAFFLKTAGMNGVCPSHCSEGEKFPDPKPYGVNQPGAIFKFTITSLGGHQSAKIGVQLHQSGYLALQTPYVLFGLGRTSNYIEQIYYGVPIDQKTSYNTWICIIPNSHLFALPYESGDPASWTLELYVTISGIVVWVVIATILLNLAIAGVIFWLYRKEKKIDSIAKQQQAHMFGL